MQWQIESLLEYKEWRDWGQYYLRITAMHRPLWTQQSQLIYYFTSPALAHCQLL